MPLRLLIPIREVSESSVRRSLYIPSPLIPNTPPSKLKTLTPMSTNTVPPSAQEKIRIAGSWSGVLEVQLSSWTLAMLRSEVARRTGRAVDCINLISSGKVLRDGDGDGAGRSLLELGLRNNCKILANAVAAADRGKALNTEAERAQRLSRLRAAALAFAARHAGGSFPEEDFNLELENQSGQKVEFGSETDRRSLMMGLMLHTNAKSLIKKQQYKDASDVLSMAEEAFSLCDPKIIEMIDNVPILELDTVWCYFMLRDISCLSVAGLRLSRARKGFERSHGKDNTRFRLLQEGRQAELAIYLRLELLEGVAAYYSGNFEESRKALSSAQAKYTQLQVPDEALSLLMNMGYKERAAKRALRMSGQDVESAVEFLIEERAKKARRREENLRRQEQIREQKGYGKTAQKKAVNLEMLDQLVSIGFEKCLAAEALRMNENEPYKALDDLTNPETNAKIQYQLELRNMARSLRPTAADIEELIAMGYDRSAVMNAVEGSKTKEEALKALAEVFPEILNPSMQDQAGYPPTTDQAGPSAANAAAVDHMDKPEEGDVDMEEEDERDEEMEEELMKEVKSDPFEDYDLEVTTEGEAILEYLALLESASDGSSTSMNVRN